MALLTMCKLLINVLKAMPLTLHNLEHLFPAFQIGAPRFRDHLAKLSPIAFGSSCVPENSSFPRWSLLRSGPQ